MGEKQVPALFKAKVDATDEISVQKMIGMKTGYMILSDFENELGYITSKVFPKESSAKASANGQQVIEVNVVRVFK